MTDHGNIGVIGAGAIGACFVRRILAHDLTAIAFDINPAVLEPLAAAGARIVGSPAELASMCSVIVTCVTTPAAVEAVVLGPNGIVETIRPNSLIIETTTSTPSVSRKIGAALATRGAEVVDAPVSRGVPAAENGTLSIMVGGERRAVDRALPILKMFGTDIIRTGALGSGHVAKALNMGVLGVNFMATAEIMALGLALGFDRTKLAAEIDNGPAASFVSAHHYPKYVLTRRFDSRFTLGLMRKDVGIAALIGAETGLPRPYLHRVVDFYDVGSPSNPDGDNTLLFPHIEGQQRRSYMAPEHIDEVDLVTALVAMIFLGTREFIAIAEASGLAARDFLEVLQASSGASRVIQTHLLDDPHRKISSSSLAAWKDAVTSVSLAQDMPLPMTGLTRDVLCRCALGRKN